MNIYILTVHETEFSIEYISHWNQVSWIVSTVQMMEIYVTCLKELMNQVRTQIKFEWSIPPCNRVCISKWKGKNHNLEKKILALKFHTHLLWKILNKSQWKCLHEFRFSNTNNFGLSNSNFQVISSASFFVDRTSNLANTELAKVDWIPKNRKRKTNKGRKTKIAK